MKMPESLKVEDAEFVDAGAVICTGSQLIVCSPDRAPRFYPLEDEDACT